MTVVLTAGKKVKGRKRHIVVDTMGNMLAVCVHGANTHDTKSGIKPAKKAFAKYPTNQKILRRWGLQKVFHRKCQRRTWTQRLHIRKIKPAFTVIPKRWVVERTFSWMNNSRRLSKDYEITTVSEEAFVMISHLHTLVRRLGRLWIRGLKVCPHDGRVLVSGQ